MRGLLGHPARIARRIGCVLRRRGCRRRRVSGRSYQEIVFHARRRVDVHLDVAAFGGCQRVAPQVEARYRQRAFRNPVRRGHAVFGGLLRALSRRHQCPVRRIAKLQVESRHHHAAVREPDTSCPDIQQPVARVRQHVPRVGETHAKTLARLQRLGDHDRDDVVAAPRQRTALDGDVLQEFQRPAVYLDLLHLEITRQFEEQQPVAALSHLDVELRFRRQRLGRRHFRVHDVAVNAQTIEGGHALHQAPLRFTRALAPPRRAHGKRGQHVVIPDPTLSVTKTEERDLLGRERVEVNVKHAELWRLHARAQHAISGGRRLVQVAGHQAQRVGFGQRLRRGAPLIEKRLRLFRWIQVRLQLREGVVVEAEIRGGEFLLHDRRAGEQRQRSAFRLVGREDQDVAHALEERAGHASVHALQEADDAVLQRDVQVFAIERRVAHRVHRLRVQTGARQFPVQRRAGAADFRRTRVRARGLRRRCRGLRRVLENLRCRARTKKQGDRERRDRASPRVVPFQHETQTKK